MDLKGARLFILSNASGYGGSERSVELLAPALSRYFFLTIFPENDIHLKNLHHLRDSRIEVVPFRKGRSARVTLKNLWILHGYICDRKPMAILANSNKGAFYLSIYSHLRSLKGIKLFLYIRDYAWKHIRFMAHSIGKATVLVPSAAVLEKPNYCHIIIGKDGDRRECHRECVIIPDPVSLPNNELDGQGKECSQDTPIVLCLATVTRWKGLDYLIKAFAMIPFDKLGAKLVIRGIFHDPEYLHELKGLIHALNLSRQVDLGEFTNKVEDLYRCAAVVVSSSISAHGGPETFGRTIIEAWSHRKPVLSFRVGGPKYLIDDGVDGILVEEGNIEEMASKLCELLENRFLRKSMGENGFDKVKNNYTTERVAWSLAELIDR